MNKIKAVIFDMDGVLIDTEPHNAKYYMKIFSDMGVTTVMEDFENLHGANYKIFWSYFEEKYQITTPPEETRNEYRLGFIEYLKAEKVSAIPGVKRLIMKLYKKNIPLALASSASPLRATEQLKLMKLSKYFSVVVTSRDVTHGKPHPEVFLKAAKKLKVHAENCLVIEDATRGIQAAKAAGMKVIGFAGLAHNKADLSGADKIIRSFNELSFDIIQSL